LKPYTRSDDSELGVGIQSRALEAFVVARKWYRKLRVLNFVTIFTVGTDPPRAAPARKIGADQYRTTGVLPAQIVDGLALG
jgi:hypothetical protein